MSEYAADPTRFVTPEQHEALRDADIFGALPLPGGPDVNRLLQRGLVARTRSNKSYVITVAGRFILHYLEEGN